MGKIVLEDFNEGNGYYKVNLAYLNKEQVEEIENLVSKWNPTDEDIKSCIAMCLTDVNEQRFKDYGTNLRDCLAWLERQGEQKPTKEKMITPEESLGIDSETHNKIVDECIYGNHKPADKVEPKFKVGDWVVQGCNILKIRCVGDEYYCFETVGGYVDDMLVSEIDSLYHLWTIQDAKDGDVLYINNTLSESIMIYKSFNNEVIDKYASYNKFGFEDENYLTLNDGYIIPATKEQHDLLFQKMKEAGYEWDAEKKELKKTSQRMVSAEAKEALCDKPVDETSIALENPEAYKIGFADGEAHAKEEMCAAWSEEDEMFVHGLIRGLAAKRDIHGHTTFSSNCIDITKTIDWLKSLKERVQPKPAEWSEEDKAIIGNIRSIIEKYAFSQSAVDVNGELCEQEYIDADNWLKSLKDRVQPKQEWSEEDKRKLRKIFATFELYKGLLPSSDSEYIDHCLSWLKSLRPQNRWKPSKEQIRFLQAMVNDPNNASSESCQIVLKDILEKLKKLKEE